eukprot:4976021-Prymnesium_polylepis.1
MTRHGLSELSASDQRNMEQRAVKFNAVKMAEQYAGNRRHRHILHADPDAAPPGAKRIYLLRHGEGFHNAWRAAEQAAGRTPTAKRHNRQS